MGSMKLIPVLETLDENKAFLSNPHTAESLKMTIEFFNQVGFKPPWIGYYAELNGNLVGGAAFKGKPVNGSVEIAYGTFEPYQQQGVGTAMCGCLVRLAQETDPAIRITARTLPDNNFSARILEKNGFAFTGIVMDPDDGEVWEWVYVS